MIFTSPIVIGVVIVTASAYILKNKTVKGRVTKKTSNGTFKDKNKQTTKKFEVEMEGTVGSNKVDETELTNMKDRVKKAPPLDDDKQEGATEKLHLTIHSIKKKGEEVLGKTTEKMKDVIKSFKGSNESVKDDVQGSASEKIMLTVNSIKGKSEEILGKTKKTMKGVIESLKESNKNVEDDEKEGATEKVKLSVNSFKEKSVGVLEKTTKTMRGILSRLRKPE